MNKIRYIVYIMFAVVSFVEVSAQLTPQSAFINIPENLFPYISKSDRMDLIDYYDVGIKKKIENMAQDTAYIINSSADNLKIEFAPGCVDDYFILDNEGKGRVVMVIRTLATPSADSGLYFYDRFMEPWPVEKFISLPRYDDWLKPLSAADRRYVAEVVPFLTVEATYDPESRVLMFKPTLGDYISQDDMGRVAELLTGTISYRWNGKKFVK